MDEADALTIVKSRSVFCDDADEFKPILAVFAKKKIYPGEEIT